MNNPYLFISGCLIFGYLAPELVVAFAKVRIPAMFNVMSAIAFGLIAASFAIGA